MTEDKNVLDQLRAELQPLLAEFVTEIGTQLGADLQAYGMAVANDITYWLTRQIGCDDDLVKRNLLHLKAQLVELAMAEQLALNAALFDKFARALGITLRIIVTALNVAGKV